MRKFRANLDVREAAKQAGVAFWEIADELRIGSTAFTVLLRHELPQEKKDQIFEIIKKLQLETA